MIKDVAIVLICVPTPLKSNHEPDLSYLEEAAKSIGKNLSIGSLIILESTVAPGTTRDFLTPLISLESGIDISVLQIAFSPERIDPLNKNWNIENTPKIVAGLTEQSKSMAIDFYSKFVDKVIQVESLEVA